MRGKDGHSSPSTSSGVCEPLTEIPSRGADQVSCVGAQALHQVVGATALERANRIEQRQLAQQAHAKPFAERAADELRAVEEHWIDYPSCLRDPLQ